MLDDRFDGPLDIDKLVAVDEAAEAAAREKERLGKPRSWRRSVCKHWLRGLCKHGDRCTYLHQYDAARMPVCPTFAAYGECNNKDCIFAHRAVEDRADECAFYNRGFCKLGKACGKKHVRRLPCPLYLQGFCPDGPACRYGHPKFELPDLPGAEAARADALRHGPPRSAANTQCYSCWRKGHFATQCPNRRIPQPPPYIAEYIASLATTSA